MTDVVPTCELVRQAASARIDHEPTGLADAEIDRHLSRCPQCQRFVAGADALRLVAVGEPPRVQPPDRLLAAVAATRASPAGALVAHEIVVGLRGVLRSRRVPATLAAMAMGVVLPIASAGLFAHFDEQLGPSARCEKLLVDHVVHVGRSHLP